MGEYRLGMDVRVVSNLIKRKLHQIEPPPQDADEFTDLQGQIMHFLFDHRERDVFQRELEEEFCMRRSTVSRCLKEMEARDLIGRTSVAHDARLKKIALTPRALEIHQRVEHKIEWIENVIRAGLTAEEVEQFQKIMQKIKQELS